MVWEDYFIEKEPAWLVHPYYDALVITLHFTNNNIYLVSLDTGSLVDILSKIAWN